MKGNLTTSLKETYKELQARFMAEVETKTPSKASKESWQSFLARCWNEFLASLDLEGLRKLFFASFGGWWLRFWTSLLEKLDSFLSKRKG